jgi:hypothetical protein
MGERFNCPGDIPSSTVFEDVEPVEPVDQKKKTRPRAWPPAGMSSSRGSAAMIGSSGPVSAGQAYTETSTEDSSQILAVLNTKC